MSNLVFYTEDGELFKPSGTPMSIDTNIYLFDKIGRTWYLCSPRKSKGNSNFQMKHMTFDELPNNVRLIHLLTI